MKRIPHLSCNFMTENGMIKFCSVIKICWLPNYDADWRNYQEEECARWYVRLIHCGVQTSSNGRRPKFHLILRCRNWCDPERGPGVSAMRWGVHTAHVFSRLLSCEPGRRSPSFPRTYRHKSRKWRKFFGVKINTTKKSTNIMLRRWNSTRDFSDCR